MKSLNSQAILVLSLGAFLLLSIPYNLNGGDRDRSTFMAVTDESADLLEHLKTANIIYLAESHDNEAAHQAQLAIIQQLQREDRPVAIALEMFQRPFQPVLDRYLQREITEDQLRQQSEYDRRWGFDWEYYAPILRYAQTHQIPLIAANTPTEISRKVAQGGLESLSEGDFRYIPPADEIEMGPEAYREYLQQIYSAHGSHGNSQNFDRFMLAQVLWDETMAEAIAQFWQANPDTQIIVLAGKGHIMYDYGIPSRVERRLADAEFSQISVWLGEFAPNLDPPADYAW
ncbi:MAG: ChaN family lipoprotein, partial [Jaaginema sp. PMC 1079.18]|nr:ChaN family lipoprotein [Jaaginema sp. PMC 1079.18]